MPSCFCFGLLGRWALCVRVGFVFTLCNAGGHAKYSLENFIMDLAHFFDNAPAEKSLWRPSLDCGDLSGIDLEAKKSAPQRGALFRLFEKISKEHYIEGGLDPEFFKFAGGSVFGIQRYVGEVDLVFLAFFLAFKYYDKFGRRKLHDL